MSDSDSGCEGLIRFNSFPLEFETAPSEIEFKLKVKNENKKWTGCIYTLKKGSPLPYKSSIAGRSLIPDNYQLLLIFISILEGLNLSISKLLKPLVNDKPGVEAGEWWKFEGIMRFFYVLLLFLQNKSS